MCIMESEEAITQRTQITRRAERAYIFKKGKHLYRKIKECVHHQ